jgi:hypothetical protein
MRFGRYKAVKQYLCFEDKMYRYVAIAHSVEAIFQERLKIQGDEYKFWFNSIHKMLE